MGCFVECFRLALDALSATQRTCISNMTPEYGSTCTLFPVDEQTLTYLRLTGRSRQQVALVEAYAKAQGFWNDADAPARTYAEVIEFDLGANGRSLAVARAATASRCRRCRSASAPCATSAASTCPSAWRSISTAKRAS